MGGPPGRESPDAREFSNAFQRFLKKIAPIHYFADVSKKFKLCVHLFRHWTQILIVGNFKKILEMFDINSIEKLNLSRFLKWLLLKMKPSEILSFFPTTIFFSILAGVTFPLFPAGGAYED